MLAETGAFGARSLWTPSTVAPKRGAGHRVPAEVPGCRGAVTDPQVVLAGFQGAGGVSAALVLEGAQLDSRPTRVVLDQDRLELHWLEPAIGLAARPRSGPEPLQLEG